jgi:thymidine kinase
MTITFNTGLMGAGKSKKLIDDYLKDQTKKVALTVSLDEETSTKGIIESRDGRKLNAINLYKDHHKENLELLKSIIFMTNADTIYIDESQFLDRDTTLDFCFFANIYHVSIYFYGLDLTFTGDLFESSRALLTILPSENINRIERACEAPQCSNLASFNARIINGKVSRFGETFVEEKSKYMALCSNHYLKN